MKIAFYSSRYGKLRVRIFGIEFPEQVAQQFPAIKAKVRIGVHAQTTPECLDIKKFDETVEVLVLAPDLPMTFEVINDKGIIAMYKIKNISEGGVLKDEPKAYQVSLFNSDKAIGLIKYQLDWLKPKTT